MKPEELTSHYDAADAAARWSKAWSESGIYRANPENPGPVFSVVIPPPNVTGSLHMGHALNNTIQDVLVRYKRMDGYNAVWVPGTDHAGIATQWVVRRQLEAQGIDFRDLGREKFVEKVWTWKAQSGSTIVGQLKRLGVSCDWSREKFTLDDDLARAVTEHFVRLYEDGLIYRGTRLINWDPIDQTAVSDLEVEYPKDNDGKPKLEKGELWSFAYPLADGSGEIVVATTRPETMLGDTAVAVHPEDPRYKHLIGKTVRHPLQDREIPIVGDAILVDPEFGTGVVKVTPAHDFNDFEVGKRHNLPSISIFTREAKVNEAGAPFTGLTREQAREAVKEKIAELGLDRGTKEHWLKIGRSQRSGAVVEPMLSTQWFVSMKPLARPSLAAVENGYTRFVPTQWENTYYSWLKDIRDWCISRQLWWGHRIPCWYCEGCGAENVSRAQPESCRACGGASLRQDEDVLDTWFSSALWPFSVFGWPDKTPDMARYYPTSVLVTGFDIIFFWVARMMFAGQHLTGTVPFKDVYIHALVRDANRQKMSKTKGNVVDPLDVIDRRGADAFRFTLMALSAQGRDVVWDENRVETYQRFVTKMWSALRFANMHREGYDPSAPMDPGPYERWIAARTGAAVASIRSALDNYKFNEAANELHSFVWGEFCDWYIELSKAALYDEHTTPERRNATKHALWTTLSAITRLIHPFMPFLSEELWAHLPGTSGFVATAPYPKAEEYPNDPVALADVAALQEVITEVRTVRGEMEISPRVQFTALMAKTPMFDRLTTHAGTLQSVASLELKPLGERPKGSATIVVRGHEIVIPLQGIIDISAEVARLDKVIAKTTKDVADLEKRLGDASFIARAPEELVAEFQGKLESARIRLERMSASRTQLGEAL
jgi:valyl-tRNA synthetase